jgi:hypothetical protein
LTEQRDGIALEPVLDFIVGPVFSGVGSRVPALAVGPRLDKGRTAPATSLVNGSARDLMHLVRVVAVREDGLEPVGRSAVGSRVLYRGDGPDRCVLHIEVVLAYEDHRKIPHGRQVQRFVKRPNIRRTVAKETCDHLIASSLLRCPGRSNGNR